MEFFFKSVIAPILVIATAIGLYLGAYLPYEKASLFIVAMRQASQATSLQEFEDAFNTALNFYSPVGMQEVQRYTGDQIVSLLGQTATSSPTLAQPLVDYLNKAVHVDNPSNHGLDFTQEYLLIANAYQIAWITTHNPADLTAAENYYKDGLKLSPTRPQFLYGLLQLYANSGNAKDALPIAEKINSYWPTDQQVAQLIPELKSAVAAAPAYTFTTTTVATSSVNINAQGGK